MIEVRPPTHPTFLHARRVTAQRNEYELETTRRLHEKTTAREQNVIRMASEGASEQRLRRCILVYAALEANGPCYSSDLTQSCEAVLKRMCPEHPPVELEGVVAAAASDALRLGLISQTGSVLAAVRPETAQESVSTLFHSRLSAARSDGKKRAAARPRPTP